MKKKIVEVIYLCDRRACKDKCSYPICKHTPDIRHAKNFRLFGQSSKNPNRTVYFEDEEVVDESTKLS